jgi:hypothetical protein
VYNAIEIIILPGFNIKAPSIKGKKRGYLTDEIASWVYRGFGDVTVLLL